MRSFFMRSWKFLLPILASTLCFGAQSDRIAGPINPSQRITLQGSLHRKAKPQFDQGPIDPSSRLGYVTMLFTPSDAQKKALDLLLAEQQNPKSPSFHKWLTPEQFGDRFGLSLHDMKSVTDWLTSEGLQIVSVARGRQFVVFEGAAAQVESAFQVEFHHYQVDGEMHFANATMPSIPAMLGGIVGGFRGFNDFHLKAARRQHPDYTINGASTHFLAPGDIATIYHINPLLQSGIDGTGEKIVLVGQTDVHIADINDFRTDFGLSSVSSCNAPPSCNTPNLQYIQATAAPGFNGGDLTESNLDLEWSGAVAQNAQLIFVTSNFASGGVGFSAQYAIDNALAPVISMSYGNCEFYSADPSTATLPTQDLLFKQAAGQGISFFVSSGDDGPATCDINDGEQFVTSAVMGLAVSYPASSAYVTAVGGTEFNEGSGDYWSSSNDGTTGGSALSYIPEKSWNDFPQLGFLDGGGGGPSNCANQSADFSTCVSGFPKPSWQTGAGVPTDGVRDVPDVSLSASNYNDPYIVCTPLSEVGKSGSTSTCAGGILSALEDDNSAFGGTSISTPIMAGITVLLNQYLNGSSSPGLGLINPTLYTLAAGASSPFHDTAAGSNSFVNCTVGDPVGQPSALLCPASGSFGFDTGSGYDLVTGLGSVDANALAQAWASSLVTPDFTFQTSSDLSPSSVPAGQSSAATLTITPVNGSTQTINFNTSSCTAGLPAGAVCAFNPSSVTLDGTDPASVTLTITTAANMALPVGAQAITVTGTASGPGSTSHTTSVNLTITTTNQSFTLASSNGTTFPVSVGGTAQINITVSGTGTPIGFVNNSLTAVPVTYTCSGIPPTAEITCNFSPSMGESINQTAVTLSLVTQGATAHLRPLGRSHLVYALLLPGLFGMILVAGSRTRGVRLLSLIVILGFSTLWLGACSGGSSNNGLANAGTPPGMYAITVNATTGGANPLTSTLAITLNVQ